MDSLVDPRPGAAGTHELRRGITEEAEKVGGRQILMGPHWGLTRPNFKLQRIGAEKFLEKENDVAWLGCCTCP